MAASLDPKDTSSSPATVYVEYGDGSIGGGILEVIPRESPDIEADLSRKMAASCGISVVLQGGGEKEEVTHDKVSRASVQLVALVDDDDDGALKVCSQCLFSVSQIGEVERTLIDLDKDKFISN